MVKINEVDLKGFKLVLTNGKASYTLATLDAVKPADAKNDLTLHLVQGSKWAGDIVADMPEDRVLMIKGSIFSRASAVSGVESQKVGKIG